MMTVGTVVYLQLTQPKAPTAPILHEFTLDTDAGATVGSIASILGSVTVDGYVPQNSTINIQARKVSTQQFTTVLQNLTGKQTQNFAYNTAVTGNTYDIQAVFLDAGGKVIATSSIVTVTAPELNEALTLVSAAPTATPIPSPTPTPSLTDGGSTPAPSTSSTTPTPATVSISGNINYHGNTPINSRVVLFQKLSNASTYQTAVDNITPIDGTIWNWTGGKAGTSYTLVAVLKQNQNGNDVDIADSSVVTVTTPTSNIILTINSAYSLPRPPNPATVTCTTYNGGPNQNNWAVTVNYPGVTGAKSYWMQVGTTDGAHDVADTASANSNTTATFNNSVSYWARYAYASVTGAGTYSDQFSEFGTTTRLQCSK